jgi:hypothetical protein
METITTIVNRTPDEQFARCIYLKELGKYTPSRNYEQFCYALKHFNKYIRKHLDRHRSIRSDTTYIRFIYDCPSGTPTRKQQKRYIRQWAENGVNDLLDDEFGCYITPHMLISPSGDMFMLYISVEWGVA